MYRQASQRLITLYQHKYINHNDRVVLRSLSSGFSVNCEKWDLMSAVSLERKPLLARKLTEFEEKVNKLNQMIEMEQSHKSDHEIKLITDKIRIEQLKKGDKEIDLDNIPEKTAQDMEDAGREELKNFQFQSRETEADMANDNKSTHRHLDRSLLLLVKEKIGDDPVWVLPQGVRIEGETMRQTAERVLVEKCGDDLKVDFFGNAPVGFYKYKYPKKLSEKGVKDAAVGAKIFFYKAQLRDGNVKTSDKSIVDFQWATRRDLNILPPRYCKSVSMFLVDEEH